MESLVMDIENKRNLYCSPRFQKFVRKLLKTVFNNYFKVKIIGKENIPKQGSIIFSCNHVHAFDPFIIAAQTNRINYSMSKKELFLPVMRNIIVRMGAYPVETKPNKEKYKEFTENYGLLIPKRKHDWFLEEINHYLLEKDQLDNLSTLSHKLFTEYVLNTEGGLIIFLPGTRFKSYNKIKNPKKGAVWNAFEMYKKYKTIVRIVPGAIIYSLDKKPFIAETYAMPHKTNVDIGFRKPITIDNYFDEYKAHPKETVSKLTNIINEEVNLQTNLIIDNLS